MSAATIKIAAHPSPLPIGPNRDRGFTQIFIPRWLTWRPIRVPFFAAAMKTLFVLSAALLPSKNFPD
jgi:hypothetical protein